MTENEATVPMSQRWWLVSYMWRMNRGAWSPANTVIDWPVAEWLATMRRADTVADMGVEHEYVLVSALEITEAEYGLLCQVVL